ncbi:class I SAM-dependent methyltransferase [Ottowia thiooxydans]|uniref:class I SAM-dependent methyltransferase n=1 Tax=Ottowia thiooxydans TaxID=219182 RepID=UPI00040C8430|nr:class I SAM-dependent methyltransferase [Ottowia thiooxydans]
MQALLDAIETMTPGGDARRIFHGRGGRYPGCEHWVLDAFPPVWVLTSFRSINEDDLATIGAALQARWERIASQAEPLNWVYQCRATGAVETRLMSGAVPEPHEVTEGGLGYLVHVLKGQNHGLFLDMAEGRRWVHEYITQSLSTQGTRPKVLNLFAYTCAFSLVALHAGAEQVVNMDMSKGALEIGRQNHRRNDLAAGASFFAHDIFSSWGKLTRNGPYDLVIVDPPSYQKGSFIATKDYARLMRRLPSLLAPGGHVLLCLNAPELGLEFLLGSMREHAPDLTYVARVANPLVFSDTDEDRSLKVLVYRQD